MGLNIYFFNILVVWCIQQVCAKFGSLSCLSSDVLLVYICILHLKLSRFLSFPCLGLSASRPPLSPHPTLNSMVFFEQLYKISSLENKNSFTGFTMTVAPHRRSLLVSTPFYSNHFLFRWWRGVLTRY